jgi:hypothetical protein
MTEETMATRLIIAGLGLLLLLAGAVVSSGVKINNKEGSWIGKQVLWCAVRRVWP